MANYTLSTVQSADLFSSRIFSSPLKESSYPKITSQSLSVPDAGSHLSVFCVGGFAHFGSFLKMESVTFETAFKFVLYSGTR